jgi:type IV secretion system protein TrbL
MQQSFASGARSSFANTGGSSTMGTVGGGEASGGSSPASSPSGPSDSGPPAWAQRMKQNQAISRGTQTAAQALKSGDSHGGGHSVDLSGGE